MKRHRSLSMRGKASASKLEKHADGLIQELAHTARVCANCGGTWKLGGHHVVHKPACRGSRYGLRHDPSNIILLCGRCHTPWAHEREEDFLEWLRTHRPKQYAWREEQLATPLITSECSRTVEYLKEVIARLTGLISSF